MFSIFQPNERGIKTDLIETVTGRKRIQLLYLEMILLAGLGILCAAGCQSLPRSGLDPYGERLFDSCPLNSLNPSNCDFFGRRNTTPAATPSPVPVSDQIEATPVPQPAPITQPDSPGALPGGFGGTTRSPIPQYGSTATAMDPRTRGLNTAMIASPDAGPTQMFEQTGGYALPVEPVEGPALIMTPREQIAPVGSEVVLISSYLGKKDRLVTNEKVEWTLEGVGNIQKFDKGSYCDPLYFDYARAKKVTDRYAITKTSQVYQHLDRGTPETRDDVHLLRGQTWISVNSMREGTTHVSAFAPSLKDWSKRTDVGIIHWVDAQWVLPQLPLAPVGESRVLTTTVLRRTNDQPRRGWIVRYEILNGPSAGFGSSLAQVEEAETDMSGQASVVLSQRELQSGTNTIAVRIIRPAGVDGSDRRVTVGSETLRQSWTGNAGVRIQIQGPATASIGKDIPYTITVSNTTSTLAQGAVALTVPPVASYISSNPGAIQIDQLLQWNVAIPANDSVKLDLVLRQGTSGRMLLNAQFYPQGVAPPSSGPSITGTSVPPSTARDPASTIPTVPSGTGAGESASVYQPPGGSLPIISGDSGATTFQGGNLSLKIQPVVSPQDRLFFQAGQPCRVEFVVLNQSNTDIQNAVLQLNIPSEYTGDPSGISATPNYTRDAQGNVNLAVPLIPAGGKEAVKLEIAFSSLPQQGFRFVGRVFVNGKEVAKTPTTPLVPAR